MDYMDDTVLTSAESEALKDLRLTHHQAWDISWSKKAGFTAIRQQRDDVIISAQSAEVIHVRITAWEAAPGGVL